MRFITGRRYPVAMAVLAASVGMAYSLLWGPLFRHTTAWITPGDLWATYRGAHFVAWGALGDVYGSHTALVSLPGIQILLAPVSMLTERLGLSEPYPLSVAHPTAWLVVGPVTLLMVAVPLCGFDALAEVRGVPRSRRRVLTALEACALWGAVCLWGHPEDVVAVGLVSWAMTAGYRDRWRTCGWLSGLAVAFQPLSALVLPSVWAWAPPTRRPGLIVRSVLPATALGSLLLGSDFSDTWNAFTKQPNYPTVDHPTPWVWFSPRLGRGVVAAGPGRAVAVAGAIGIGMWIWRNRVRGREVDLVWWVSVAFAVRCVFEPVMVPYYITPFVTFSLLGACDRSRRLLYAGPLAIALTAIVYLHAGPVRWWLEMMALVATLLACAKGYRTSMPRARADSGRAAVRFATAR